MAYALGEKLASVPGPVLKKQLAQLGHVASAQFQAAVAQIVAVDIRFPLGALGTQRPEQVLLRKRSGLC